MNNKPKIHGFCKAGCSWETVHKEDVEKSVAVLALPMGDGRATATTDVLYKIKAPAGYTGITGIPFSTSLPTAASGRVAVAVGTKVYLFGCDEDSTFSGRIQVFNTETEELFDLAIKLPYPLRDMAGCAVGNDIYLFGGYNGSDYSDSIIKIDTLAETVTEIEAKLGAKLGHMGAATVGKKIYLFGGANLANGSIVTDFYVRIFDVETSALSICETHFNWYGELGVCSVGAAAIGEDIYLCGGRTMSESDTSWEAKNCILKFNTATKQFAFVAYLQDYLWGCGVASAGDYLFIAGGDKGDFNGTRWLYRFNVKEKNYMSGLCFLSKETYGCGVASVGAKCYCFGGGNRNDHEAANIKAWTIPTYQSEILMKWRDSGKVCAYSIPIVAYDEFRNTFTFEALDVRETIKGKNLKVVYEINGERLTDVVYGSAIDVNSVWFEISGEAVYAFNEGAKTIGRVGLTGAIPEVESLPENPDENSPSMVLYDGKLYILTGDGNYEN